MSDDSLSAGSARSTQQLIGDRPAEFLRAEQARVGNWLAIRLRWILFGLLILEIPLQCDTYLFHDLDDAAFGAISGFNLSLTTICLVVLYAQWLPRVVVESIPLRGSYLLTAYIAFSALSILWATDKGRTLFELFMLFQAFLIFVYVVNHIKTQADIMFVVKLLVIGLAIQGAFMVVTRFLGNDISLGPVKFEIDLTNRVTGSFGSPNVASSFIAILVAPCLSLLIVPVSNRLKWLVLGALGLGIIALVLSLSRGGWLATGISMAIFFVIAFKKQWLSRTVFAVLLTLAVLLLIGFHQILLERLLGDDNGSALSRIPLNELSWRMIAEYPLGVGANNWDLAAQGYANANQYREEWFYFVHNRYLLVLAEIGWFGFVAFMAFLASIVVYGWRALNQNHPLLSPLALGLTAGFIGQTVHMGFDVFNSRSQIEMMFLIAALIVAVSTVVTDPADDKVVDNDRTSNDEPTALVSP